MVCPLEADVRDEESTGRRLFETRVPWLSTLLAACVIGLLSWAVGSFFEHIATAGRKDPSSRGLVTLEEAVAASLRGEGVIVDARSREERERDPVRGGAILPDWAAPSDLPDAGPDGIPGALLESLQEVPIYLLCSPTIPARVRGLRLAKKLRDGEHKLILIRSKK